MPHRMDRAYLDKKYKQFTEGRPNHTVQDLANFASAHGYCLNINFVPLKTPGEVIECLTKESTNANATSEKS